MRGIIKKVPIPTAGVALGLAALGNLLQPYSEVVHLCCGALAFILVLMLCLKIILFPQMVQEDLRNSILASVSATLFMTFMQLAGYLEPYAFAPAFALWFFAVSAHLVLMIWFTFRFIRRFKLQEVFPTYFICYVGIVVASVTAPKFGMESVGLTIFWLGFALYLVLLGVVTYRYLKHEAPESARPLFCIYAAPMSLSLTGYLATSSSPHVAFVAVMLVLAQIMYVMVLFRLPLLLRLKFYPSYAAMTFPFVITATALGKTLVFFRSTGIGLPAVFDALFLVEVIIATVMVLYVFGHYVHFFFRRVENPTSAKC